MIRFACMELMWGGVEGAKLDPFLAAIAAQGFDGGALRFATLQPLLADPAAFRARLDRHRLALAAAYLPLGEIAALDRCCDFLRSVGCEDLVLHGTPARDSGADPRALAREFDGFGARAAGHGVRLSFHHHAGTLFETLEEYAVLLEAADPAHLALFLDTGHATQDFAGHPVAERARLLLERFPTRPRMVEFKAWTPEHGLSSTLGSGPLDLAGVAAWLTAAGHRGWITLEQNAPTPGATPVECAARSLAAARLSFAPQTAPASR
ncbi:MAG: sugar phosphate isomerase/epimerase family protein [Planctomycetota bacterium]